jgi:hypothetical protein
VLVRARGALAAGEPGEVPFGAARAALEAQGALCVKLSRSGLSGPKQQRARADGTASKPAIEERIIAERCAGFHPDPTTDSEVAADVAAVFEAEAGEKTGRRVLDAVAIEPVEGETVRAFAGRVRARAAEAVPGIEEGR